ncbi:MAG: hypothetical protein U0R69_11185 [Gaiellales bacterium]
MSPIDQASMWTRLVSVIPRRASAARNSGLARTTSIAAPNSSSITCGWMSGTCVHDRTSPVAGTTTASYVSPEAGS